MSRLVLASASPRRREILAALGVDFEVVPPTVDELTAGAGPEQLVVENARRKANAGLTLSGAGEGDAVIGVDTEVVLEGRLLGKAGDIDGARERLEALSGRTHEVLSGLVVLRPGAGESSGVARSLVSFEALDEGTLDLYLASGEWRDRAGAYAIQGLGALLVAKVEGDFSNVVGLPLRLLFSLLPGIPWARHESVSPATGKAAERGRR
jgi:septum formation protein